MTSTDSTTPRITMEEVYIDTLRRTLKRGLFRAFDRFSHVFIKKLGTDCSIDLKNEFYKCQYLREIGRDMEAKYGNGCLLDLNDSVVSAIIGAAPGQIIPFEHIENSKKHGERALEEFASRASNQEQI